MPADLVVKYFGFEDIPILNGWLDKRGVKRLEPWELPAVGFMVSIGDTPVAACFLRRCEGNVGIVEGLTSNPDATPPLRHAALDAAISCVCDEAKAREITKLMAWTVEDSVITRGNCRHGFISTKQKVLVKAL